MTRIAIIEDDAPVRNDFSNWMNAYDPTYEIDALASRKDAEVALSKRQYDLILLDIRLGSDNNAGVGIIHDITKRQSCPVIVISGMPADIYRGIMYELKAWDYLTKPITEASLIAVVINALKQRAPASPHSNSRNGALPDGLDLNPLEKRHAVWQGKRLVLPLTAQRILNQIALAHGRPVSFSELFKLMPYAATNGAIATHISTIRAAFKAVDPQFDKIVNVPLVGYSWRE